MQEFGKEDFYKTAYGFVKRHSATNNAFIDRFAKGDISESEFIRFSIEFYHFTREWVSILSTLLVNTPDESDAALMLRREAISMLLYPDLPRLSRSLSIVDLSYFPIIDSMPLMSPSGPFCMISVMICFLTSE